MVSAGRRRLGGIGIALVTVPLAITSRAATPRQEVVDGTETLPITASASSPRSRKGKGEPSPHATWRTASSPSAAPVALDGFITTQMVMNSAKPNISGPRRRYVVTSRHAVGVTGTIRGR